MGSDEVMGGRFDGMPKRIMEAAEQVDCARCKVKIADDPSLAGTVLVNYYVPVTGAKVRTALCGACGLSFREFMHPEVLDAPGYAEAATRLRAGWGKE